MEKKNRDLAKKNTELKEKISKMTVMYSELLKTNIKREYTEFRIRKKAIGLLEDSIGVVNDVAENLREIKAMILRKDALEVLEDKLNAQDGVKPRKLSM
ncbi:hypothetical protein CWI42_081630 [Ordospora colligata]|uniref:Uncharacterized protein n=1 Tax=Ordospora colligata OC4 TaxID=1354746 RepID=A0A0B2UJA1_9MICR|nr:uncharacterized protein M896_081630 [Ordospora colligata OC4]KHN69423.1 hypothetical protein M896_081630 [Ordospora colligata OC4]TBU14937.1 hypothetical protein CWI41_081620 [Ordospora colligata]TBU15068.1 hypothetical protein CWI40_081640 [Ordospora colligata]TBU18322.1 hypothetical protein CWI42_081630 [Ordospora colligata]